MYSIKPLGLATVMTFAAAAAASAALVDFTNPSSYSIAPGGTTATGMSGGIGFTVTTSGGRLNNREAGPGATVTSPLAGTVDGLGIQDDEITFPDQTITVAFDRAVTISRLFALDLFQDAEDDGTDEGFTVNGGDAFLAQVSISNDRFGFGDFGGLSLTGMSFTFAPISTNDNVGNPDFALAGIEFEPSPIPLPAGVLLLGGALAGLGFARRGRKTA